MVAVIDEDLPRLFKPSLEAQNWTVFDIRDTRLRGSSDESVFKFAQRREAVIFSADLGFANIQRFPIGSHYGIVVLRFPNELSTQSLVEAVLKALNKLTDNDIQGNLLIIEPGKLRIRKTSDVTPRK